MALMSAFLRRAGRRTAGLVLVLSLAQTASFAAQSPSGQPQSIWSVIDAAGETVSEREELRTIYQELDGRAQWTSAAKRAELMKLLMSLDADGIDAQKLGALPGEKSMSSLEEDVAATRAVLRAAHLMNTGAIDAAIVPDWHISGTDPAVVPTLLAAARAGTWESVLTGLRPSAAAYSYLRTAYLHYRRLAMEPWEEIATGGPRIVERDDPRLSLVMDRLHLLGDLQIEDSSENAVDAAIRRFQTRHGLEPDGRIGPVTLRELNVPPAARARQIAVNLEYWRLLPRTWPERYIAVNTAAAQLDLMENGVSTLAGRVIVGDLRHATPLINTTITAVTFNPPWSVPISIATKEMLPRLQRDPSYLERNNIEIVGRTADPHGLTLDWRQYSRSSFPFQLRQVPGPKNALGLIKFEMPNAFDVYLHDTPDHSLFEKSSRALSHGCVRVQCSKELAERLINDPSTWLSGDILATIQDGRTLSVRLKQPLPVYLLYFTAFADKDGVVHFRPDLYGRDAVVQGALAARAAPIVPKPALAKGS